jgi:hypothetical protein
MDADFVTKGHRPESENDIGAEAMDALRAWHRQVREALVILDTPKYSTAIRSLVAWYERAFFDAEFEEPPPSEGLDAVVDELALAAQPIDSLRAIADARWAIRVGEELVKWRQCRSLGPGASPLGSATNRLELALEEARRQLEHPLSLHHRSDPNSMGKTRQSH